MKQGTLFSFFSKKPPAKKAPAVKSKPGGQNGAAAEFTDVSSGKRDNIVNAKSLTAAAKNVDGSNSQVRRLKVGNRVEVLWPDDNEYYAAKIVDIKRCGPNDNGTGSKPMFSLLYDDGETEELDLNGEDFRVLLDESQTTKRKAQVAVINQENEGTDGEFEFEEEEEGVDGIVDGNDWQPDDEQDDDDEPMGDFLADSDSEGGSVKKRSAKRSRLSKVKQSARPVPASQKAVTPPSTTLNHTQKANIDKHNADTSASSVFIDFASDNKLSGSSKTSYPRSSSSTMTTKSPELNNRKTVITPNINKEPRNAAQKNVPAAGMFQEGAVNSAGTHLHNHLSFLFPPKLKDTNGTLSTGPNYDTRTLYFGVTEEREILKHTKQPKLTPASKQWWEIKSQYFDTVLFFKTGKFYELYHMDADIGCKELGFVYMKGILAHSGFPEAAYGLMSGKLIDRGYKVARVEQTETPDELLKRKKSVRSGPKPMVVNREVCCISSIGTRTYCFLDDTKCFNTGAADASHGPLLSIREVLLPQDDAEGNTASKSDSLKAYCEYGVTIVDAVRSIITVGQFADDILRSRMHTLLTAFAPSEIILNSSTSKELKQLIQMCQTARVEHVRDEESFPTSTAICASHRVQLNRKSPCRPWDANEAISEIHRKQYYASRRTKKKSNGQGDNRNVILWPEVLRACVEGGAELALSSFGASLYYLQRGLVDDEIIGFGNVKAYVPPGSPVVNEDGSVAAAAGEKETSKKDTPVPANKALSALCSQAAAEEVGIDFQHKPAESSASRAVDFSQDVQSPSKGPAHNQCPPETDHMQLDGTTIENLEVLLNQTDRTPKNSLWAKLNHTKTPHGNRLLKAWLLRPLFRKTDIDRRMDAVSELATGSAALAMNEARSMLSKVGDLERLLSRVHSMGGGNAADSAHPNERAMLYEGPKYTKRKVEDFRRLLTGLEYAGKVVDLFAPEHCTNLTSSLLQKILRRQCDSGIFPDAVEKELAWFRDNFDVAKAKEGLFEPTPGIDEDYDKACAEVARLNDELENYRLDMCQVLGRNATQHWKYINTAPESRDKYLIELPVSVPVPASFYVKGKRGKGAKQVNKYRTQIVEKLVTSLDKALEHKKAGKDRGMQIVFQKFDSRRPIWSAACQVVAMLDALGSLAHVSSLPDMVRPTILDCVEDKSSPVMKIHQGRHFCVDVTHYGGNFIPNDLGLGGDSHDDALARVLLLSGPNMGGKSTLLRQTCLIAILGQIGCFVPAAECSFTPLDRIFTRLGATDRILSGQSTFFVELAETAAALRGSTRRSLVIMDELGRGTSTFDGTAIASATVQYLIESSGCLALFATHYHSLLEEWKENPSVRLGHMECIVGVSKDQDSNSYSSNDKDHSITFLYTLGEGSCPKSFGINVARLAGLPEEVLTTATKKSSAFELEINGLNPSDNSIIDDQDSLLYQLKSAVLNEDAEAAEKLWKQLTQDVQ
jgi:DNA mismatch repair protein MSH6